jgi:hypothetical protein
MHDQIADYAYGAARTIGGALARAGAHAVSFTRPDDAPAIEHSVAGRLAVGGGANHFDLLNHPAIYAQIRQWLAGRPALAQAAG